MKKVRDSYFYSIENGINAEISQMHCHYLEWYIAYLYASTKLLKPGVLNYDKGEYGYKYDSNALDVHGGVTYFNRITCMSSNTETVKIGWDYNHYGDAYRNITREMVESDIEKAAVEFAEKYLKDD